ncbi:hypothetical protein TWF694_008187 [Orbilia ellipsospora]|uniref:Uncharacterized protein n=1 Tax=Orbilia ellipsospora TaxID=2528407 RepID=A0AAV9XFE4_9PEZI
MSMVVHPDVAYPRYPRPIKLDPPNPSPPNIILPLELNTHEDSYVDMHMVALVDPGVSKSKGRYFKPRNHNLTTPQAIALLLTTQPGEDVAVNVQQLLRETLITFVRSDKLAEFPPRSVYALKRGRHSETLRNIFLQTRANFNLRSQTARSKALHSIMPDILKACLPKVLHRVEKLRIAMHTTDSEGTKKRRMVDEKWNTSQKIQDCVFHPYWLARDPARSDRFADAISQKLGYSGCNPDWDIADWLQQLGKNIVAFDTNGPTGIQKFADGFMYGIDEDEEEVGHSVGVLNSEDQENAKSLNGQQQGLDMEGEYYNALMDIVFSCAALIRAPDVEIVVRNAVILKRIMKVGDYVLAAKKILETVHRRKADLRVVEIPNERRVSAVFPKDAQRMLELFCHINERGEKDKACDSITLNIAYPLAKENAFPSTRKPYGDFKRIKFTIHPAVALAIHLGTQPRGNPKLLMRVQLGTTKAICYWCEAWLSLFGEISNLRFFPYGCSGKRCRGWRFPVQNKNTPEAIVKSNALMKTVAAHHTEEILEKTSHIKSFGPTGKMTFAKVNKSSTEKTERSKNVPVLWDIMGLLYENGSDNEENGVFACHSPENSERRLAEKDADAEEVENVKEFNKAVEEYEELKTELKRKEEETQAANQRFKVGLAMLDYTGR